MSRRPSFALAAIVGLLASTAGGPQIGVHTHERAMYEALHGRKRKKGKKPPERVLGWGSRHLHPGFNAARRARRGLERAYLRATGRRLTGRQFKRIRREDRRHRAGNSLTPRQFQTQRAAARLGRRGR